MNERWPEFERVTRGPCSLSAYTGNKGSALPQTLLSYSAAKAIGSQQNENDAAINSILTAAESVSMVFCPSQGWSH